MSQTLTSPAATTRPAFARLVASRLLWITLAAFVAALILPLWVSGYILGLLTVAYYFGVFSMAAMACRSGFASWRARLRP